MILDILFFLLGIVLIILGANFLTDGAAALARRFGLSPLMVGLTIVAMGTSTPELVVSLMSALEGSSDISLGNVVGSNIFNVLGIGGVTALVMPLVVMDSTVRREIPLMLLASIVIAFMAFDGVFSGLIGQADFISRSEGLVLLGFFLIFLSYTIAIGRANEAATLSSEPAAPAPPAAPKGHRRSVWILLAMIVGGLGGLIFGGQLFVDAASSIARRFGVSEAIIGLTLVAVGTSLPELATSVAAVLKGEAEIAIGNIVGSNIFNIFFILGLTATITPIRVSGVAPIDFGVMIAAALLLGVFGVFFGQRRVTRIEGGVLVVGYIVYVGYLMSQI